MEPLNDEEVKYLRYLIRKDKAREADLEFADSIPTEDEH